MNKTSLSSLALASALTMTPAGAAELGIEVISLGKKPATRGSDQFFAGQVFIDQLFQGSAPARISGGLVSFTPGARTAWHTHPLGQTLYVVSGVGRVQMEGGPVQEIRPGDVVWIPANTKHWHGATPDTPMSHLALAEQLDGQVVTWLEQVSETQYHSAPAPLAEQPRK
ncbi:MAG TPA: cupin domain-containing protein [Rhodocyclaceae bacterium]